ncbi:MAG: hypothetical protein HYS45_02555 [Parcubacteria group bacterium]|nr:hypothetical protein [Parcubacteria group bacterium]
MEQRTKAFSIIAGALILFGLLVAVIFDLFPGGKVVPVAEEAAVVLPDRDEALPSGAVFDAGNADAFAGVFPGAGSAAPQSPLAREAQDVAVFFLERFGTYSSDSGFSYLDDLAGFETSAMAAQLAAYRALAPARDGFYAITAELASIETDEFLPEARSARFNAVVNRSEVSGGATQVYQQEAVVGLAQSGSGTWLVDSVVWGSRR